MPAADPLHAAQIAVQFQVLARRTVDLEERVEAMLSFPQEDG